MLEPMLLKCVALIVVAPSRRGFEILLRKCLAYRQMPAVVVLHWWSVYVNAPSFWDTVESQYQAVANYYGLASGVIQECGLPRFQGRH